MDAAQPWDVVPGKGVGGMALGMPLTDAVRALRSGKRPERTELVFCAPDPLAASIVLHLPDLRVLLDFDSVTQKLKSITVYKFDRLSLRYANRVFSSPSKQPTFRVIYTVFGPTHPGEPSPDKQLYRHNYPGATFVFDMPAASAEGASRSGSVGFPAELNDGSSPPCRTLVIYCGASLSALTLSRSPVEHYQELVLCNHAFGTLHFTGRNKRIQMGMSCQSLLGELGSPDAEFSPRHDRMLIHYGTASMIDTGLTSPGGARGSAHDYFLNYFSLGIDAQIDGELHVVKRIILHTNAIAHVNFGFYRKIRAELVDTQDSPPGSSSLIDQDVRPAISSDMKWETIRKVLGEPFGDPVVSGGHSPLNPFGPTFFYGYDGVIFEVIESGYLASIILFPPARSALNATNPRTR